MKAEFFIETVNNLKQKFTGELTLACLDDGSKAGYIMDTIHGIRVWVKIKDE